VLNNVQMTTYKRAKKGEIQGMKNSKIQKKRAKILKSYLGLLYCTLLAILLSIVLVHTILQLQHGHSLLRARTFPSKQSPLYSRISLI